MKRWMFCKQVCLLCITGTEGKKGNLVQHFFFLKQRAWWRPSGAMLCQRKRAKSLIQQWPVSWLSPYSWGVGRRPLWAPEQSTCDLPEYSAEYSSEGWQRGAIILTFKFATSWWQWTGWIILFYALCVLRRENVSTPTLALSLLDIYFFVGTVF